MTKNGILIINTRRFRTEIQNRDDAQQQLIDLLRRAEQRPKLHLKTAPTFASKRKRSETKHYQSKKKGLRRTRISSDE